MSRRRPPIIRPLIQQLRWWRTLFTGKRGAIHGR